MKLGFTGTREGMTFEQLCEVELILLFEIDEAHHGDCIGADADLHRLARSAGLWIVGHPPIDPKLRAFCEFDEIWPEKQYLVRNVDIVICGDILLATPKEMEEQKRGGTWSTIRYAREIGKPRIIVWPNGEVEREGFNDI